MIIARWSETLIKTSRTLLKEERREFMSDILNIRIKDNKLYLFLLFYMTVTNCHRSQSHNHIS